jgi:cell division protein FtsB
MAISDMLQKAEADKQKALEQQRKWEEEKRQRKIKNAAAKKARLEKQLKKLKDALEDEAIAKDAESLIEALSK